MSDRGRGKSKTLRGRPRPLSHTHNDMSSHVAHHATPPLAQEDSTNVPPTQSPPNVVAATPSLRTSHSTPSPRSSETGDEPIIGSSESQTVSDDDKTTLILAGQGFLPSHRAANIITDIFKSHYTDPWASWKKIPKDTRNMLFGEFMSKCSICPPDYIWAKKNFEARGAYLMKSTLSRVRTSKTRPDWLGDHVWNGLREHWDSVSFNIKSAKAKANRASDCDGFGQSLHIGGSITTSQHKANMIKKTGTTPTQLELFRQTHQRKDATWVDKKSEHVNATFESTWEEKTQKASEQNAPPPNELDVWLEVASVKKGRIYGLGMESTVMHNKYRGSSSSSSEWVRREEFDQLRDTLDITQKMVRQMMEMMQTTAPTNVHTDHGDNSDDLEESEDADDLGGS